MEVKQDTNVPDVWRVRIYGKGRARIEIHYINRKKYFVITLRDKTGRPRHNYDTDPIDSTRPLLDAITAAAAMIEDYARRNM